MELIELVEYNSFHPCRAIEFGCGAGNYAIYLAGRGFDVTGVDWSEAATGLAQQNARKRGVACTFVTADVLGELPEITGTFGFAFDWMLLHHIVPGDRERYIRNVCRILDPGALYLSASFSETDTIHCGSGKIRTLGFGGSVYFSSEDEIRDLLAPHFLVRHLRTIELYGKSGISRAVYALAERR